jgi:RecA-family ATPase
MNDASEFSRTYRYEPNGGEPPPHYGDRNPPPPGGEEEPPLPKLVPLKRVKGRVREWSVLDWVPKRTVTLLQGDGGLGKSTLLQQLQSSWATRLPWVGLPVEECASLGVYTEDEDQDIDLRQDIIDAAYGLDCVATGKQHMLAMAGEDSEMVVFDRAGNPTPTKFYRQICEAAMDYHVGALALDVAVDLYGGNEIMRRQVRAFMRAVVKLARMINGPAVMTTHVSQAGIQSDGGHSGSTDWSNASRSRAYLSALKDDTGGPVDPDARILTRKKANNARLGETVKLRWQKGLFVPEATSPNHFRRPVEDVFLALLDAVTTEGQTVSPKSKASNYAPALFMKRLPNERDDYQRADFERALQALFQRQKIKIATYGRASWNYEKIVRAEPDGHDQ